MGNEDSAIRNEGFYPLAKKLHSGAQGQSQLIDQKYFLIENPFLIHILVRNLYIQDFGKVDH